MSGTTFLTAVLVGRWTSPSELGIYSIGFSLLASLLAFQDSLILLPYTIQRHRPVGTPAQHAGSSLMQCGLLSASAMVMTAAVALGLSLSNGEPKLVATIWTLAAVIPFALLRGFGRGFVFARLEVVRAVALDFAVAVTQFGALGWLGLTGRMSAATACAALGAACALPGIVWLFLARADFAIQANQMREAAKQSWGLGKWLCAGQITGSVQGYATYWLLPLLLDLTATGVFAACMSIASSANPLVAAFRSTLTPRAVLAFKQGGGAKLWRQAIHDSLLLGAVMISFCIAVLFGGEQAIALLFHSDAYRGYGYIITVLAVGVTVAAVGSTASNALASMERPRAIVWTALVGTVVTLVLVWFAALAWGLVGAAYGLLAGNTARTVARWFAFRIVVSRCNRNANLAMDSSSTDMDSHRTSVIQVLQQSCGPKFGGRHEAPTA